MMPLKYQRKTNKVILRVVLILKLQDRGNGWSNNIIY